MFPASNRYWSSIRCAKRPSAPGHELSENWPVSNWRDGPEPLRSRFPGTAFGNLTDVTQEWHHYAMPHFPQPLSRTRAPRVRVPNEESIRFDLGGRLVSAVLHKLSLTGGLAEFNGTIGGVTIAEARLNTSAGPVSALVEFLPRRKKDGATSAYPFRFIALGDQDYERLSTTLQLMRKHGLGDGIL
jgi:hypothetical protein